MSLDHLRDANRATFAELVARPERDLDLARGALLIAAAGRPHLDPQPTLDQLDHLADLAVRADGPAAGLNEAPLPLLTRLHAVLFGDLGLRAPGPGAANDPGHSLLDVVMATRVGLPISLAIVELEVARRVGLPLFGVGLPGHFIVGGPDDLLLDPADAGRRLTWDDCQALIRRAVGEPILLQQRMLRPSGKRAILARVLRNLRVARLVTRDWPAALASIELLEVLEPNEADHARDRGLLLGRMGRFSDAVALLGAYLELNRSAGDADDVRQAVNIFAARRN